MKIQNIVHTGPSNGKNKKKQILAQLLFIREQEFKPNNLNHFKSLK